MKSKDPNKKSKFPVFMGIIWGLMVVVGIMEAISIFSYKEPYYKRAESISNNIATREFGEMCMLLNNQISNGLNLKEAPEYSELLAVKAYVEAEGLYRMYAANDKPERAEYYYNKMQSAGEKLGRFAYLEDEMDRYFGK